MHSPRSLVDHFLIAMPAMDDPDFARGVTLICQHDEHGAMGVIINRESDFTLGDVLKQMDIPTQNPLLAEQRVLHGGPVQTDRGFVLHDDPREWNSTLRFGQGFALTTSRDILVAMAGGEGPERQLMTLGYAGWSAGQLEEEIAANAWLTVPADQAIVFDTPVAERWRAAAQSLGVDLSRLSDDVGHA